MSSVSTMAGMSLRIMDSGEHQRTSVDPFQQLPCLHETIWVHITNGERLGDDIVECVPCGYTLTLSDLYAAVKMPEM